MTAATEPTPWQQFQQLTGEMLAAVQEEDWERLTQTEALRAALLPALAHPDTPGPDQATLHALQEADARILLGARARLRQIGDFLGERQQGRRMRQAYDGMA